MSVYPSRPICGTMYNKSYHTCSFGSLGLVSNFRALASLNSTVSFQSAADCLSGSGQAMNLSELPAQLPQPEPATTQSDTGLSAGSLGHPVLCQRPCVHVAARRPCDWDFPRSSVLGVLGGVGKALVKLQQGNGQWSFGITM